MVGKDRRRGTMANGLKLDSLFHANWETFRKSLTPTMLEVFNGLANFYLLTHLAPLYRDWAKTSRLNTLLAMTLIRTMLLLPMGT